MSLVMQQGDSEKEPSKKEKESAFIMRKQTKLVAVLSASALLAIGASVTSFAASGRWAEENGTWVFYDKSGDKVTEEWQKSGEYWYWLNEDGEMATDQLIEDDDNYYYVNENGVMVQNGWRSVENEDYDGDDEDEPMNYWYYFGANGKAYKSSTSSNNASFKTINGKKYVFDGYGKMQTGLRAIKLETGSSTKIADDGVKDDDDLASLNMNFDTEDAFKENVSRLYDEGWRLYYMGGSNDGAVKTGKQTITIDGDSFTFLFNKSGSSKGQGKFGIDDDKYYAGGMLMAADRDDKYAVVKVVTNETTGRYEEIRLLTTEEFLDDDHVKSLPSGGIPSGKEDDYDEYIDFTDMTENGKKVTVDYEETVDGQKKKTIYRVVNTASTVQKSKSKAKDGDDRCYKINGSKQIEAVFVED